MACEKDTNCMALTYNSSFMQCSFSSRAGVEIIEEHQEKVSTLEVLQEKVEPGTKNNLF